MNATVGWSWDLGLTLIGLGAITLLTRGFFLLPKRDVPMPAWLRQGLRFAPLAALAAAAAPEVLMTQGHLISSSHDARPYAALAGALWFWWRGDILGTIVAGMAVFLPLRLGLGW